MGRVINTETAGKERTQLMRAIVLAMRELMNQTTPDSHTLDLAAFIAIALQEISNTIDVSVAAWEKRGYWIKADRFRMDWAWAEHLGKAMQEAVLAEDWVSMARTAAQVTEKVNGTKVPQRHKLGTPWEGALAHLQKQRK